MSNQKTLDEIRDELGGQKTMASLITKEERQFAQAWFSSGFDAGARAVMERAAELERSVIKVRDVRRSLLEGLAESGDLDNALIDMITKALANWEKFKAKQGDAP